MVVALGVGFVVASLASNAPLAQDKDKIVTDRQDVMKQQGRELVVIRNYSQGKADQQVAKTAIESLKKSVPNVPTLFPAGTGIGEVTVKTAAKPEIWREHDKFLADHKTVLGQITTLDTAIQSGDTAKVAALVKEINYCASCHNDFRAEATP
jgi:cytochrome c556